MFIALVVLHTLLCLAIIGIVLLQSGKGADIGSAFGGAGSQAVFGSMGTPTVLSKITTAVAVLFLATSFGLALLGSRRRDVGHPGDPGARGGPCSRSGARARWRPTAPAAAGCPRPGRARARQVDDGPCHASPPRAAGCRRPSLGRRRAASLLAVLLAGCQGEVERVVERVTGRGSDEPAYGDTLIDSMLGNISGLIPNITSDNYSHEVGSLIYNGLVDLRPRPEPRGRPRRVLDDQPRLPPASPSACAAASPGTTAGPSPRPTWSSPSRRWRIPKTPSAYKEDFQAVERIEAPDPYTVEIVLPDVLREVAPELGHAHAAPAPARDLGAGRESSRSRRSIARGRWARGPTASRSGSRARRSSSWPTPTTSRAGPTWAAWSTESSPARPPSSSS